MTDIELKLLIGLHRVCNEIDRRSSRIFAQYGLSLGQFAVLEALYSKGDLSVGEVQKKILSTSGTIPVIVSNLAKQGLLERQMDLSDKRKCILHITEEGKKLMEEVFPKNKTVIIDSMANWSEEEKEQMLKILKNFE